MSKSFLRSREYIDPALWTLELQFKWQKFLLHLLLFEHFIFSEKSRLLWSPFYEDFMETLEWLFSLLFLCVDEKSLVCIPLSLLDFLRLLLPNRYKRGVLYFSQVVNRALEMKIYIHFGLPCILTPINKQSLKVATFNVKI